VRELGLALITAGAVVLLFVVYDLVGTNLTEERNQAALARQFDQLLQAPVTTLPPLTVPSTSRPDPKPSGAGKEPAGPAKLAPTDKARHTPGAAPRAPADSRRKHGAPQRPKPAHRAVVDGVVLPLPPPGGALDHLVIPSIGVDRYVVQGVDENDLQEGPGHYPGTPLPGELGNVGIAGHRTTFGAPFFRLDELKAGDLIYLTDTSGTTWVYSVQREWVVAPTDVDVLAASVRPELTLTTCNPRFEAVTRLVVRATLADRLATGTRLPGQLPTTLSTAHFPHRPTHTGSHQRDPTAHGAATKRHVPRRLSHAPTKSTVPTTVPTTVAPTTTSTTAGAVAGGGAGAGDNPTIGPATSGPALTGGGMSLLGFAAWAMLALAAWVLTRLVARRQYGLSKFAVLVAGALVCLLPLWFVFENAVNLLPANF